MIAVVVLLLFWAGDLTTIEVKQGEDEAEETSAQKNSKSSSVPPTTLP